MGWIRTSHPAKQLHKIAASVETGNPASEKFGKPENSEKSDIEYTENTTPTENTQKHYPIQPRTRTDKDLPFLLADEVRKRNGKEGERLC